MGEGIIAGGTSKANLFKKDVIINKITFNGMQKKLYRSRENKLVAGVLSGFAEYFDQDATFWRLGFIIVLILTGLMPGVLIYLVAWVIIPERPMVEPVGQDEYTVFE